MNVTKIEFHRFNQKENLYLTVDGDVIPKRDQVITMGSGAHMHYGINEYGIVSFGIWEDDPKKRPGHGGFWSSRESIVGPMIGKRLVPVAINRIAASMIVEELEKILPAGYQIVPAALGDETIYNIQKVVAK